MTPDKNQRTISQIADEIDMNFNIGADHRFDDQEARTIRDALRSSTATGGREAAAVADQIIGQIEERFPNWYSFRDLIDCIDCTLHELRSNTPASGAVGMLATCSNSGCCYAKQAIESLTPLVLGGDDIQTRCEQPELSGHDGSEAKSAATFQERVRPWMLECFGPVIPFDKVERNHRFLEEALELVQSLGCTTSEAHQLVDYVFGRPICEPVQESGGVSVTHAALCLANDLDMDQCAETELARIWTKVEKIRAKQAAKPKHSPLPQHVNPHPTDNASAAPSEEVKG